MVHFVFFKLFLGATSELKKNMNKCLPLLSISELVVASFLGIESFL